MLTLLHVDLSNLVCGYIWAMPRMLLFCDLDLQFPGHWWSLKGQILAIFSHFGPVLIYRKSDHPMAGIYNTYICTLSSREFFLLRNHHKALYRHVLKDNTANQANLLCTNPIFLNKAYLNLFCHLLVNKFQMMPSVFRLGPSRLTD